METKFIYEESPIEKVVIELDLIEARQLRALSGMITEYSYDKLVRNSARVDYPRFNGDMWLQIYEQLKPVVDNA